MDCCNLGWLASQADMLASYDTANGMDCCNMGAADVEVIASALRYRERYGLLQLVCSRGFRQWAGYDTANGMDCCNFSKCITRFSQFLRYDTANGMDCCN